MGDSGHCQANAPSISLVFRDLARWGELFKRFMATYRFRVLGNAESGGEDEFNHWYTNRHILDVLKVLGFVARQRFVLSEGPTVSLPTEWTYIAIYEADTDDIASTITELRRRSRADAMPVSDALPRSLSLMFSLVAERVRPISPLTM
jgi:predicted metal-dependent HD superfamily phosphohydrolase